MFEDLAHNLVVPHARGMVTTLVVPKLGQVDHRDAWDKPGADHPHVHFVTNDLEGFLTRLVRK